MQSDPVIWRSTRTAPTTALAAAMCLSLVCACSETGPTQAESNITEEEPIEIRMQALFDSVLDGVQLIESAENVEKVSGPIDETTAPPHYEVAYEGCASGHAGGTFCVREGRHLVDVFASDVHIIRRVDQRYDLEGFGSVADLVMTGALTSSVDVTVDTVAHTTQVLGAAAGELQVSGAIDGAVVVDLVVEGGRNYTESAATPLVVSGTMTYRGVAHPVDGGFHRD